MAHLKGQNVNLLIGGAIVAASTSCDFSLTANTADAASKSDANPMWDNSEFTYYDWSASNESFVCSIADMKTLITKITTGDCKVQLQFQVGESATSKLICKKGDALLTSLSVDAPADGYAKLSLSFEGNGPLTDGTWTAIQSATTTKIKGKALMVAVNTATENYHTLCAATGHKLSISAQTSDTKTKDDNDKAVNKEITGKSMTLSTDNLVDIHESGATCIAVDDVMGYLMNGSSLALEFGYYEDSIGSASIDWEDGATIISGTFLTTSVSINGANKDNATFSAEFACKGVPTIA